MCLGVPGRITEIIDPNKKLAIVDVSGVKRQVNIACIVNDQNPPESCVGNWVLIHVGFAMNRINEREAAETLKLIEEIVIAQLTMSNYE